MKLKFQIEPQLQVLEQAASLLQKTFDAAFKPLQSPEDKDARVAFIYRHARNISDSSKDVLTLGKYGQLGSIYLLARPALESLFKLAAATNEEDFAIEKVIAEIQEEQNKLKAWSAADEPRWDGVLNQVIQELQAFELDLRQRYEVNRELRWKKPWQVAKAGNLQAEYVRDYFIGSKHVHVMVSALVDREGGLYILEALHRMPVTACHAAALTNRFFCVAPSIFDDALEIQARSTELYSGIQKQIEEQFFSSNET